MKELVSLLLIGILLGCSNDSNQESEGVIADKFGTITGSKLSGLRYQSGELVGFTDQDGRFGYLNGEMIQFFVGDIPIGVSLEAKEYISLADLAEQDDLTTINITRFLLTLDDDDDAQNGIRIEQSIHQLAANLSLDFTSQVWELTKFGNTDLNQLLLLLTSETLTGAKNLVTPYSAYTYLTTTMDMQIDELKHQIINEFNITECSNNNQCKFHKIPSSYIGYCAPLFDLYVYSETTTNKENVEVYTEQRHELLTDKLSLYNVADIPRLGGSCFTNLKVSYPVCNNLNNCEISDEIPIVIIE